MAKAYKNAFDAIYEDDKELAENLKIRSQLLIELGKFIEKSFKNQSEAKEFFGESQSTISAIVNGNIDRFTIDKLVQLNAKAGYEARIKLVKAKKKAA